MMLKKIKGKIEQLLKPNKVKGFPVFEGSRQYWEERYKANRNSGSGSYGRLSEFKAEVLNSFVAANQIQTVIEYGCGDGNQLLLAKYPKYIGIDVSKKAISICKKIFKKDKTKSFYLYESSKAKVATADLSLSLDVIYHLVEDEVFEDYMKRLFKASTKFVIIYSSNFDEHSADHVRSRKFTNWIDNNVSQYWLQKDYIKNIYPYNEEDHKNTSMADFYIYQKK